MSRVNTSWVSHVGCQVSGSGIRRVQVSGIGRFQVSGVRLEGQSRRSFVPAGGDDCEILSTVGTEADPT